MSDFKKYLNQQLKNKEFKKEWDNLQPEMELIRTIVKARVDKNITQKELSVKTGINQADISKLETGTRKPSLKILEKIADALDMAIKIEFIPRQYAWRLLCKTAKRINSILGHSDVSTTLDIYAVVTKDLKKTRCVHLMILLKEV